MLSIEDYIEHQIKKMRYDLVFLCGNRPTAKILLKVLYECGYRWSNGESLLETDKWHIHKEKSSYCVYDSDCGITVDPIDYYSHQYPNKKIIDLKFYRVKEIAKCLLKKK
jgi:hypothetical protein